MVEGSEYNHNYKENLHQIYSVSQSITTFISKNTRSYDSFIQHNITQVYQKQEKEKGKHKHWIVTKSKTSTNCIQAQTQTGRDIKCKSLHQIFIHQTS